MKRFSVRQGGFLALVLAMASACGGTTSGSTMVATGPQLLYLGDIQMEDGQTRLRLYSNGRLEGDGQFLGTVLTDGRFILPDGTLRASMSPDGTIRTADNRMIPVVALADGRGQYAGTNLVVGIGPDGSITGPGGRSVRVSGASSGTSRTVFFVLGVAMDMRTSPPTESNIRRQVY
jgi:hypothetical protein